jgi:hypothetical protein
MTSKEPMPTPPLRLNSPSGVFAQLASVQAAERQRAALAKMKQRHRIWVRVVYAVFIAFIVALALYSGFQGWAWIKQSVWNLVTVVFGIVGLLSAFLTAFTLEEINNANQDLIEHTLNIQEAERLLRDQITNLEDATRRNLVGFGQIFARALWMLSNLDPSREVWYVNFLFGFGSPHRVNQEIRDSYRQAATELKLEEKLRDFDAGVDAFWRMLKEKMMQFSDFRSVTLPGQSLLSLFMGALKERDEEKADAREREYEKLNPADILRYERDRCNALLKIQESRDEQDRANPLKFWLLERIPMQIMIASVQPSGRSEAKAGCLVFLVGTESVGCSPQGFYTELDPMVMLHKHFAEGLLGPASTLTLASWGEADKLKEEAAKLAVRNRAISGLAANTTAAGSGGSNAQLTPQE